MRISNFGQTGPNRDFAADDLIEYAAAGILQITGEPDREPVALGQFTPLFLAGAICAPHALGAMRAAHRDQQPEVVDFSIQEALAGSMDRGGPNLVSYQYTGSLMFERRALSLNSALPNGVYPCADGYIQTSTQVTWYRRVFRVIGRPEWIDRRADHRQPQPSRGDRGRGAGSVPGLAEAADQAAGHGGSPGPGLAAVRAEHPG